LSTSFINLADQRMVRNLDLPNDIFLASLRVRKNRSQQVVGPHSLDRRRDLLPSLKAQQSQGPPGIPSPTRGKHRRIQHRLRQDFSHRIRMQKVKYISQRKAVLLGQRKYSVHCR